MFGLLERFNRRPPPPPSPEESERRCRQALQEAEDAREKARLTHPVIFHGTTAFDNDEEPISLSRDFGRARCKHRIFASHLRVIAASYAAVIKNHPHMDGFVQHGHNIVPFLVIDDKETYLENIQERAKFLCALSSQSFTPDIYMDGLLFEWTSDEPSVDTCYSHRYESVDEILQEGVQFFFTKPGTSYRDVGRIFREGIEDDRKTLKKMVRANLLEWENRDKDIAPSRAFL